MNRSKFSRQYVSNWTTSVVVGLASAGMLASAFDARGEVPSASESAPAATLARPGAPSLPAVPSGGVPADRMNAYEADVQRFLDVGRDYRRELNRHVRASLEDKRRELEVTLGLQSGVEEESLHARRLSAIEYFESFLARHPNEPEHTPDAMFRLAELYFEKGAYDLATLSKNPDVQGGFGDADPMEVAFGDSLSLYDELVRRFPEYRNADAARYVQAYLLEELGQYARAVAAYRALVDAHPRSRHAPEAYLRLGEIHFEEADWDQAVAAYSAALAFQESRLYDKALYKLAWTHFQRFDYDSAIKSFKELIAHYDGVQADDTGRGRPTAIASELRGEAIEYLARSLAEDDWDGDGEADANAGVARALAYLSSGEKYEREVLSAYASALYDLHEESKYQQAIEVYDRLMGREPTHEQNPQLYEKVVAILDILGRQQEAERRRLELVGQFGPKSAWYRANASKPEVIARADALVELAARQGAQLQHKVAQDLRRRALETGDRGDMVAAADAYARASDAYRAYLDSFPNAPSAPDLEFYLAETLFFTGRLLAAADVYEKVRDTGKAARHLEPAAFSAVKALEQAIAVDVAEGRLPPHASPTFEGGDQGDEELATAAAMPPLVSRWIAAIDAYAAAGYRRPDETDTADRFQYQAALVLMRLGQRNEGRRRAEALVDERPQSEVGGFAATLLIDSYRVDNDWAAIEKWAKRIEEQGIGKPSDQAKLLQEVRTFKLGSQFQRAEALLEEKRYVEAAEEFQRIVDEDRDQTLTFADKALYNAALAYEMAKRYDSAARMFERIVTEARFSKSPFVEDALFRLAENHHRFFDFDRAANRYLALVERNPQHAQSAYALGQAAQLLENDGNHRDAAQLYERFHRLYPSRPEAASLLFEAAAAWAKAGDSPQADRVCRELLASHATNVAAGSTLAEARLRLANSALAQKKTADAAKLFQETIADVGRMGAAPGSSDAAVAAEAQFRLVELKYEEYKGIELKGTLQVQGRQIKRKQLLLGELEAAYAQVFPHKALEWTFAAYFRIGQIYEDFARMLYAAPTPSGLSEDELEVYQLELEDIGVRFEDTAVARYETAVQKARELKYDNEWTRRALQAINRFRPAEYPLQREPKRSLVYFPFLESVVGAPSNAAAAPKAPSEVTQ